MVLLGSGGALASICHFLLRGKIRGWGFQSLLEWRVQENAKKKKNKNKNHHQKQTQSKATTKPPQKKQRKSNDTNQKPNQPNQLSPLPPKKPYRFCIIYSF